MKNLNKQITSKEIESIIKYFPMKKAQDPHGEESGDDGRSEDHDPRDQQEQQIGHAPPCVRSR